MDCVNHKDVSAKAFCQNCGKALCADCIRNGAAGQILCEPCWQAWQGFHQPFPGAHPVGPNPSAAAVLGIIPGVGAMYNGQFFKGFIHVAVFVVLVSLCDHYPVFGFFIAAWIIYQSFEAYHTARARREGAPLPDPLGLNQVEDWLHLGRNTQYPPQPGSGPAPGPGVGAAPFGSAPGAAGQQPPYTGTYQNPYQPPYQAPYQPYNPSATGYVDPTVPTVPPVPPVPPPMYWRRREPIGAIVLIGLGSLFLLGQLNFFNGHLFDYTWPLLLICLGVWLVIRRISDSHGGSK